MMVAVGSNIDPEIHIPSGLRRLHAVAPILASSCFYQTEPIGRPEQPDFWNGIVVVKRIDRHTLRTIEALEGRVRSNDRWMARVLDLDILEPDTREGRKDVASRPFLQWGLADLDGDTADDAPEPVAGPWPF